jgi:hypothetical protein
MVRNTLYGGDLTMKMEITVKIKNDDGTESIRPITIDTEIPEFEDYTGPDNFREVFNRCEKSVSNQAAELAIEEYLVELLKKKVHQKVEKIIESVVIEDNNKYKTEGEIGRLDVSTFRAVSGSRTLYNTQVNLFTKVGPKEMYRTACYTM